MPSNHLICHPLLLLPSIFPAPGSFPMSQLFTSGGQSIGVSGSVPVLPKSIQGWFPLGLTGMISLKSKGLLRVFSSTTIWKHQFLKCSPFLIVQLSQYYWKDHNIDCTDLCQWVISLLFNTLSRFVITFLQRSNCHLISWAEKWRRTKEPLDESEKGEWKKLA